MARPETLIPGNCYFSVGFYDHNLALPMIQTLVYVGQKSDPDYGRMWLFNEPLTPPSAEDDETSSESAALIVFSDKQLHEIVDFNGLMRRIREIAANHPLHPIPQIAAEPAADDDFEPVAREVSNFLNTPEYVSLTMTIRFTDDAVSLGRHDGRYHLRFFTHPRRDPDEDTRIFALFASIGVTPLTDSFMDHGRTHILQFPAPTEGDAIIHLCRRVLTEVYAMRRGDDLDFYFLRESDVRP